MGMALLLFGSMFLLPMLTLAWVLVAHWLYRKGLRGLALGTVPLIILPLCYLFPDVLPVVGYVFRAGGLAREHLGTYAVLNLGLLFGGLPMLHFFVSHLPDENGNAN